MGLFGRLFGDDNGNANEALPWIALEHTAQLREIKERSETRPQFVFKHSTTCGISRMVFRSFTQGYSFDAEQADLYYLDLHAYRNVSNEVARQFEVIHQSPQLLVVKNGRVVFHASHGAITDVDLAPFL